MKEALPGGLLFIRMVPQEVLRVEALQFCCGPFGLGGRRFCGQAKDRHAVDSLIVIHIGNTGQQVPLRDECASAGL